MVSQAFSSFFLSGDGLVARVRGRWSIRSSNAEVLRDRGLGVPNVLFFIIFPPPVAFVSYEAANHPAKDIPPRGSFSLLSRALPGCFFWSAFPVALAAVPLFWVFSVWR